MIQYFVAGVKLTDDPITNVGTKMVKNIPVKSLIPQIKKQ